MSCMTSDNQNLVRKWPLSIFMIREFWNFLKIAKSLLDCVPTARRKSVRRARKNDSIATTGRECLAS